MRRVNISEVGEGDLRLESIDYIEGNPFYGSVKDSPSALWVVENEGRVKRKIYRVFQKMGQVSWDTKFTKSQVDECYDYMAYYFIEYSHNEFDEDYFKNQEAMEKLEKAETMEDLRRIEKEYRESDNNAIMEYYIMNRVYNIAMSYVRTLKKIRGTKRIIETSEAFDEEFIDRKSCICDGEAALKSIDTQKSEFDPEFIIECQEYDDMFNYDLDIYDKEFQDSGLNGFSMKDFVYALFLSGFENDDEICDFLGVSNVVLDNYRTGFRVLVKGKAGRGGEYEDLMLTIKELIEGVKRGWKPSCKK